MQQVCWLRRLFYRWLPPRKYIISHAVKSWPLAFSEVRAGTKTFELRFDDRGYSVGHIIRLEEWYQHPGQYTQRWELVLVTHMLHDATCEYKPQMEIPKGWVIMSIKRLGLTEENARDYKMHTLAQPSH